MLEARVDRVEATLARLVEAQAQTQVELRALAEAQRRAEERLETLTVRVEQLAQAQQRTEERLERLVDVVGGLRGEAVERRDRERAAAYFDDLVRGIQPVSLTELAQILDTAQSLGALFSEERKDLLNIDVVIKGRRRADEVEVYLVAEVSAVIDAGDVRRAARRAELLGRAAGVPVIPAVAGEAITSEGVEAARNLQVWCVLDGRAFRPDM